MSALRVKQLTEAAIEFNRHLEGPALRHLEDRGLAGVVNAVGLGCVPGASSPEWAQYEGMISIPYWNLNNECVAIRFRNLREGGPKYLQPSGSELTVYNMKALNSSSKTIIITEGEFDAMALTDLGYAAVGMPGANSWKHYYSRLFDGFDRVVAWGDPDDAGRRFNEQVMKSMRRATAAYMEKDINDTAIEPMGFTKIADAFQKAGGQQ